MTSIIFISQVFLLFFYQLYLFIKKQQTLEVPFFTQWFINLLLWISTVCILLSSSISFDYFRVFNNFSGKVWLISLLFIIPLFLCSYGILNFYLGNFLTISLLVILAIGNSVKLSIRGDALLSIDLSFQQLKEMSQAMMTNELRKTMVFPIIVYSILLCLTFFLFFRYHTKETKNGWLTRLIIFGFGFLSLWSLTQNAKVLLHNAGISAYLFSPKKSLEDNGTILHFVSRMGNDIMEKPAGYSSQNMQKIIEEIGQKYSTQNKSVAKNDKPNIVFILSEAFWDPMKLSHIEWEEDPMPTIRSLIQKQGGDFLSPEFGGNTANVEYSVMSGFSSNFIKEGSVPYVSLDSSKSTPYSIVSNFKNLDYRTLSIHPFEKTFYNRDSLFVKFGFDESLFNKNLIHKNTDNLGSYISDNSLFKEIEYLNQKEKLPYFFHTISMQNHYPYTSDFKKSTQNFVKNANGSKAKEDLNRYANGVKATDNAMKQLISYYEKQERETLLVFYGDHLPVLDEDLLTKGLKKQGEEIEAAKHKTEYFIWSNKKDLKISGPLSANYLAEAAFKVSGLPLTPFQEFLDHLRNEIPDFGYNYEQKKLSPKLKEELKIYELLQYDMIQGEKYSKKLFEVR